MDRKWINTIAILLTMIFTGWAAQSSFRQANIAESALGTKQKEISKDIEQDRHNHNYYDYDTINVTVQDYDLIFKMKVKVNDGLFGISFTGFKVGQVDYKNTEFGITTFKLIEKQLDKYFYTKIENEGVYLIIKARGSADGIPVNPKTYWWGETIWEVEYYNDNDVNFQNKKTLDFIKGHTLLTNEHFAVLRAYFIVERLKILYPNKRNQILIVFKEYNEVGAEYRRCDLQLQVKNAFKRKYYDELGWGARKFIDWGWVN